VDRTVTRVRIDFSDGTYSELSDPEACKRWSEMVDAQATMAFVHGMKFEPLPWTGTAKEASEDG
jgi:hypothetical protein